MTDAGLLCEVDARGVATLTLHRPERGNAYHADMLQALLTQFERLQADSAIRLLVLRGQGKHFCVGADLSPPAPGAGVPARHTGLTEVCQALDGLRLPTVALVHGACIGGGLAFAACCDLVLAEANSFFSIPEVRIGFAPAPLVPFFLRAMGARQLRRYGLSGERFPAAEAQRIGLVHQVVESIRDTAVTGPAIDNLLHGAPGAQAELKSAIARLEHASADTAMLRSLQQRFDQLRSSDEALEGRAAFAEKRDPRWYRG